MRAARGCRGCWWCLFLCVLFELCFTPLLWLLLPGATATGCPRHPKGTGGSVRAGQRIPGDCRGDPTAPNGFWRALRFPLKPQRTLRWWCHSTCLRLAWNVKLGAHTPGRAVALTHWRRPSPRWRRGGVAAKCPSTYRPSSGSRGGHLPADHHADWSRCGVKRGGCNRDACGTVVGTDPP